jgi:hypothetical protein
MIGVRRSAVLLEVSARNALPADRAKGALGWAMRVIVRSNAE